MSPVSAAAVVDHRPSSPGLAVRRCTPGPWRLLAAGVFVLLGACSAPAQPKPPPPAAQAAPTPPKAEPVRAEPTRPTLVWPVTKLRGTDYVAVREIAKRHGLKAVWTKADTILTLSDGRGVRFTFERDQRDFHLDGTRVFLGDLTLLNDGDLWVPRLDVIKTITPIFAPGDVGAFLPEPPKVIVLDPGHGGTDPGMQNLKLKLDEKNMTLDVALRLKKLLELRGHRVILTRSTDTRFSNNPAIDLPLRAQVAAKEKADLFISIHFNAVDRDVDRVSGTETYVLTPQFQVSTQPEQDRTMVREAYAGNRQDTANALLGFSLHRRLIADLKGSDRGYKRYRYAVLRTLDCPGVLVEAAYLSNDAEARRVGTPEFRQQIAAAIAEGVADYTATLAVLRQASSSAK